VTIGGLEREVGLARLEFGNGGFWLHFVCPRCSRHVKVLKLHDGGIKCSRCLGRPYRVEYMPKPERARRRVAQLIEQLNAPAARVNPRKGRTLDRRSSLTLALKRNLLR
jgi:hypothetical protein